MKIKIISDGTNAGTQIIDEDTGEEITNCTSLKLELNPKMNYAHATLVLNKVPFELTGNFETRGKYTGNIITNRKDFEKYIMKGY